MLIINTIAELKSLRAKWSHNDESVAVVPTMGSLHAGHLSLVRQARIMCDRVIVTLFVNPLQFNQIDDLEKYPRNENHDQSLLKQEDVDILFFPTINEVYPNGFATHITITKLSETLCGAYRPGHFDGVATIVAKLFSMTGASHAFFGEKDWQQLQIIKRLVADLNMPIHIISCPTVREKNGLAMSSRNERLSLHDRKIASILYYELRAAVDALQNGQDIASIITKMREKILVSGFNQIDYIEFCEAKSLEPLHKDSQSIKSARLLAAAWLGQVRLIDNVAV